MLLGRFLRLLAGSMKCFSAKRIDLHRGADRCSFETHYHISSAPLDIERIARGARGHWGVESMHWLLDVEFKDDLSRYRTGHGAKNMTIVRRFALGLVRANKAKRSVKSHSDLRGFESALTSDPLPEIVWEKILLPPPPKAEPPSEEKPKDA
jgi:predicted transposase YbfD/YdcC